MLSESLDRVRSLVDAVEAVVLKAVSSRKFLAAAAAFTAAVHAGQTRVAAAVAAAYVLVEGFIDSKSV